MMWEAQVPMRRHLGLSTSVGAVKLESPSSEDMGGLGTEAYVPRRM